MYVHEAGDSSISSRDLFDTPVDLSKRLLAHAKKVTKNFREVVVYFVVYNVYLRSWWVGHTECTFSYRFTPCVYTIEYIILTFTSDLRPKITWGFPPPPVCLIMEPEDDEKTNATTNHPEKSPVWKPCTFRYFFMKGKTMQVLQHFRIGYFKEDKHKEILKSFFSKLTSLVLNHEKSTH